MPRLRGLVIGLFLLLAGLARAESNESEAKQHFQLGQAAYRVATTGGTGGMPEGISYLRAEEAGRRVAALALGVAGVAGLATAAGLLGSVAADFPGLRDYCRNLDRACVSSDWAALERRA